LNNIKEIKILSSEKLFYDNFVQQSRELKKIQILQGFYASIPPYIIEILVVISLLLMACILSIQNMNSNSALIASFAIVVASLFRIAPALNRIQSAIIAINTSRTFVKQFNSEHEKFLYNYPQIFENQSKMDFKYKITFENVNFNYIDGKDVIKNISFDINKGDFVGIIGLSGAGKSTIADILTGLLPIDSGRILVDGQELNEKTFPQFRRLIGYVPQQINVLDKPFRENVAFGCENINDEAVIKALKVAQIYDVIMEYPEGINSNVLVGSTGLSQGQKQRLAIARALYRDPEILILDEATSALDVQVENEITEMLKEIGKSKTIISIAHRLSTLKACNKLIYLKDGKIVDIGTFDELCSKYPDFDRLVKLSKIN
jgi:ATP-binding cassette subfamily C protein